ncbi:NAD(P)-binding domain-containing protein [Actinocorallia longicatena]|uniref:NAD(P)-binding domain-containing protein n=1 Tax=Actinocorallia longicatena TaxID=111803 RepID=A0ABP6QJE2_9ACTN
METDVVVIGAGQAGLSAAHFLDRYGLDHIVLDASEGPGGAWRERSPSLTMDGIHGVFDLPGMARTPVDGALPARVAVPEYYARYEESLDAGVLRPVEVTAVRPDGGGLLVETSRGLWAARAIVNATGTWTRPHWPSYPGMADFRGEQLHYAGYRGPGAFAGRRVIVVGGGASAAHVLSELADVAETRWVTRREPVFHDGEFGEAARREAVARVERRVRAGLPPQSVVSVTGLGSSRIVRDALAKGALERHPMFARLTADGALWPDGSAWAADAVIWATGFRSAIRHLAPLRLREPGGGIRLEGTRALADPRVHLVGYGPSASTIGANRAGRAAALDLRDLLARAAA